ncbi:MAG: flippase-like domain-containing protein [Thermomicrobiales bacterium]|nr:flippase-like domain-containing protein [Thermomicrobiales bacterium]
MPELDSTEQPRLPDVPAGHLPPDDDRPDVEGNTVRNQLFRPRTVLSFGVAIAILAIFVTRADLDLDEIWTNIKGANLLLLAAAFAIYFFTLALRAMRWRWMLAESGVGSTQDAALPGTAYLTGVYTISWLINCVVPAKLGDAYRAYRVKRDDGIRYSIGFGTIIGERVFDLAVLVVLLATSGLLAFHGSMPGQSTSALILGVLMVVAVAAGLLGMHFFRDRIESLVPARFRLHYTSFQAALFQAMSRPLVPATYAVVIWLCEGLRVYLVAESLDAHIGLSMAIFVALLSALLTTMPFTPAGLGVVEVAIVTALTVAGYSKGMAGSVAILDRLITYWSVILVGAIVAVVMMKLNTAESHAAASLEDRLQSTSS